MATTPITTPTPANPDQLLDPRSLGRYLGMARQTIYGALKNHGKRVGEIIPPPIYLGTRVRWRKTDVERWLDSRVRYARRDEDQLRKRRPGRPALPEIVGPPAPRHRT